MLRRHELVVLLIPLGLVLLPLVALAAAAHRTLERFGLGVTAD